MNRKYNQGGLAFYGVRQSGDGIKGKGYFGPLAGREGTVTELSAEDESGEFPLVVPTLTAEELELLLAGKDPTSEIMDKARSWADTRRKRGKSPFAEPMELRMPKPKAKGGSVSLTDLPDDVTPANWREHLQNNVLADARALLGVKDGGVINLDELIEQSLKKKDGGVINLDELIEWTMAKEKHRKMKEGGGVHMQGGGNPGEVSGEMSKPKPLSIPEPITDLVEALRRQFEKEKRSMRKPGAAQDVLMRGPVAAYVGAPADIVGMGGELLDYFQKKIPALRKPASVMDTGPEKEPPMGYAPTFPLSPEGSYGTTEVQEMLGKANLTTSEERPLFEMGAMFGAPVAGYSSLKAGKALAPTAKDMLDIQLQRMMKPYQMAIAPEGKAGKVKAPANSSGYYNPVEKAALNLQRKQGSGSAMVSDMKKTPGVNDERLAELGLGDLASRPNVTKEELLAATQENRIPLRESVKREPDREAINKLEEEYQDLADQFAAISGQGNPEEVMRISAAVEQNRLKSIPEARFGPSTFPNYNMPGGENYREIRVGLPDTSKKEFAFEWFDPVTQTSKKFATEAEAKASAPKGAVVQKSEISESNPAFYHSQHHGDEPNVLFHLRVADHVDEEGKKGLLIDELQSDWHQQGREKGYGNKVNEQGYYVMGVPDAPFKDNWYQLGLKRAIKEAADNGMDRVYLTTGNRQTLRYTKDQRKGMEHWYDKTYKNFLDKYAKQHGGKLGETKLLIGEDQNTWPAFRDWFESKYPNGVNGRFANAFWPNEGERSVSKYVREFQSTLAKKYEPVYYIDITDAMRESAKKGQSYAFGGGVFNTDPDTTDSGRIIPHNI